MTRTELLQLRRAAFDAQLPYAMTYWRDFNYKMLRMILYEKRAGRGDNDTYNDCIIMFDTETSKKRTDVITDNHVVAFTISIRAFDRNIVTLWGRKPSDCIQCMTLIHETMPGDKTIFYCHNYSYDYVFLRQWMFRKWGFPEKVLNTKSHYPILMCFQNGIIIKDSLILAQRSLEKWSEDLAVEHQKAVGKWDYDKIRTQHEDYTADELEYIEHDTLAGVECIDATMKYLDKHIYSIPYTATGIPREEVRKRGIDNRAHDRFMRQALTAEQQVIAEMVYHGGYTHGNRHYINTVMRGLIQCYDFTSSYPYCLLSEKFPCEKFMETDDCTCEHILEQAEEYAFMFKLIIYKPELHFDVAMPSLQMSKCVKVVNPIVDNGRIISAELAEIWLTELDLQVIYRQYSYAGALCTHVLFAKKDYLPRWFTDLCFEYFDDKQKLKGGDPVSYAMAKAKLNSLYGITVQKPVKENIIENYETGEYITETGFDYDDEYNKYVNRYNSVLNYQIGIWVTAAAFRNLFDLSACCGLHLYSDTDSCYGMNWDYDKLNAYNEKCKDKLRANGYGACKIGDKEYWLGVAALDHEFTEYIVQGAKRYCGRDKDNGKLIITVAGVPKKRGALVLNDNIENFRPGLIFPGTQTGKKTHTYFYHEIYKDAAGNETGDSIDLSPCDYLLDSVYNEDWDLALQEDVEIQIYEEEQ